MEVFFHCRREFGSRICSGVWQYEHTYPRLWFLPVWHNVSQTPCCCCICCWCRFERRLGASFIWYVLSGVSWFSLRFMPLRSVLFFPCAFEAYLVLAVWEAELLDECYLGWAPARNFAKDLFCFLFFLLLQFAAGS